MGLSGHYGSRTAYSLLKMNAAPLRIDDLAMSPGPRRGVIGPARAGGPARGGRSDAQYTFAQFAVATDSQASLRMAESRHDSTAARGTSGMAPVCRTCRGIFTTHQAQVP